MNNIDDQMWLKNMAVKIIRCRRKTLAIEVKEQGIIVKAPLNVSKEEINKIISKHKAWIEKSVNRLAVQQQAKIEPLSPEEIEAIKKKAQNVILQRVKFFTEKMGVTYGRITIRCQHSRWGSCSNKGNLNFNCLLLLTPPEVLDSVVVHELCHLKQMNHSKRFYNEVLSVMPDYYVWNKWLKENGSAILKRIPKKDVKIE